MKASFSMRIGCGAKIGGLVEVASFEDLFGKPLAFSRFVRMPIEGFESEILTLLWRLESRKKGKNSSLGKKKVLASGSRFERELCKLQCSINYDSVLGIGKRSESSFGNCTSFANEY